ncbi:MAG: hypothetical protein BIFFINMI_02324 [Phycisphaerae bacterium]|nr:hypothetical protein [Phycisphaerae bacterium]
MTVHPLATFLFFQSPWGKILLSVHLLIAACALGAVTHLWWEMSFPSPLRLPKLRRYARWSAITVTLSWFYGVFIYPAYNVAVRMKGDPTGLDAAHGWATGLFEWKEDFASVAMFMLPLLLVAAYRWPRLRRWERVSVYLLTLVFTLAIYYAFVIGGVVTMVKGLQ